MQSARVSDAKSCPWRVNSFDVPELMPGAQPRANPAQRAHFEQRCQQVYAEDMEQQCQPASTCHEGHISAEDLEAMFPNLEPMLIQTLLRDASSPQHALETLLALSSSTAEPAVPPPPAKDLSLQDADEFPILLDADGWQLPAYRSLLDHDAEVDMGSVWSDRAKSIVSIPEPARATKTPKLAPPASCRKKPSLKQDKHDFQEPENDCDLRRRFGAERIENRKKFQHARRDCSMPLTQDLLPREECEEDDDGSSSCTEMSSKSATR